MPNNLWLFFLGGGAHVYIPLPRSGFVFGRLFLCYAAPETSFCLVGPVFRPSRDGPVPNVYLSLRKNTERILMKFAGVNHYHEQIK